MRRIAFDCESHLIQDGQKFPRLVCVSFASYDGAPGQVTRWLRGRVDGCREVIGYLQDPEVILVGFNTSYDLGVVVAEAIDLYHSNRLLQPLPPHEILKLVFDAYEANRVSDVMVRSMLWDIARGIFQFGDSGTRRRRYGLAEMAEAWCGIELEKKDTWRLNYAWLTDKPISTWPQDAIDYAELDADVTAQVDMAILAKANAEGAPGGEIPDEWRQCRAAWVLHLISAWGVRVDAPMVLTVRENLLSIQADGHKILTHWGVLRTDGTKDMKRLRELIAEGYAAQGKKPPMTKGGAKSAPQIATGADDARASGHPAAMALADIANVEKLLSTYVPALMRGADGQAITCRLNVLVASGRTSCQDPNWQNPPRVGGIRECLVPRPGMVFCAADLDTVELRALAQSCLEIVGYSEMAAALKRGDDLHLSLAAEVLGLDYGVADQLYKSGDPTVSHNRQEMKKPNFGFPGGMGPRRFAEQYNDEREDGVEEMTEGRARELREAWFRRWPEMRDYLAYAGTVCDQVTGTHTIQQPWSNRIRGGLDYCSAANTLFQGRVADGCKLALWRIAYACYVDITSPLYGSRIVLFLHDEVICEVPEDRAHECSLEIVRLLCGAVQEVIPDIPITSMAVLMRRWFKGAKPVYVDGRLFPGKPEKQENGKTKWVADI